MDYNRIDVLEGTGVIWQGGTPDAGIDEAPFTDPVLIICMDRGEANDQWINHTNVEAVLAVWIDDVPTACLSDTVLRALADASVAWLKAGGNIYVHCAAGISRATYMDTAIHCTALGVSADQAISLIKAQRPVIDPNPGFAAQLHRLWP